MVNKQIDLTYQEYRRYNIKMVADKEGKAKTQNLVCNRILLYVVVLE